jgi:hypothetical protein
VQECLEDALPGGRFQVQRHAALAAVHRHEIRAAAVHHRQPLAVLVAAAVLHLDHLGPEIGEELSAGRAGEDAAEVEHADAMERRHRLITVSDCMRVLPRPGNVAQNAVADKLPGVRRAALPPAPSDRA